MGRSWQLVQLPQLLLPPPRQGSSWGRLGFGGALGRIWQLVQMPRLLLPPRGRRSTGAAWEEVEVVDCGS